MKDEISTANIKMVNPFSVVLKKSNENCKFHNGYYYFPIRLHLQSESSGNNFLKLSDIDFVSYRLDSSFPKPLRISYNRSNNFEITIWTYGFFILDVVIYAKWGQSFPIKRIPIEWSVTEEEKKMNGKELEW